MENKDEIIDVLKEISLLGKYPDETEEFIHKFCSSVDHTIYIELEDFPLKNKEDNDKKNLLFRKFISLATEDSLELLQAYNLRETDKKLIDSKLEQVYKLLSECTEIAEKNNTNFDFDFEGMRDTYDAEEGRWQNSYC